MINPSDYGLVADAAGDQTTAMTNYANACIAAGETIAPEPGTYRLDGGQVWTGTTLVQADGFLRGSAGVTFDFRNFTGSQAWIVAGTGQLNSNDTGTALASNVAAGAFSIPSGGLTAGANKYALLTTKNYALTHPNDDAAFWVPGTGAEYRGEFHPVRAVSGSTATLARMLREAYTTTYTTVYLLTMPVVRLRGFTYLVNRYNVGLYILYGRDLRVRAVRGSGARDITFLVYYCDGGLIGGPDPRDACYTSDSYDVAVGPNGDGYGIEVASCQGVTVQGNVLVGAKHCGVEGGEIPCRGVQWLDNYMHQSSLVSPNTGVSAFHHHSNSDRAIIARNFIVGGADTQGSNVTFRNNTIIPVTGNPYTFQAATWRSHDFFDIVGNHIQHGTAGYSAFLPITENLRVGRILIDRNRFVGGNFGIYINAAYAHEIGNLTLTDNIVADNASYARQVLGGSLLTVGTLAERSQLYTGGSYTDPACNIGRTIAL
jgi:hypothetical protein